MSRKLDALVAEKVMGLELCGNAFDEASSIKEPLYKVKTGYFEAIPRFSATWSGMGEVIEKMEAGGWDWTSRKAPDGCYFLQFVKQVGNAKHGNGWSERTFPGAVCIAALRAKGVPEQEIQEALNSG